MTLSPRCHLTVAPRFHLAPDWAARLAVGVGVQEADGRFFSRGPWRSPTADELTLLTSGPAETEAGCLFQIPEHLRAGWWDLLDKSVEAGDAVLPQFEDFANQVAEFLRFKHLAVPTGLHIESVVTAAGRGSMRSDPATGVPAGLGPSFAPWASCAFPEAGGLPRLWAVVNLGDENTQLVLIPHTIATLATNRTAPLPTTVGELAERFLRESPNCSPLRMRLGPGEGFCLPPGGLILDTDPTDKQEPDVLLLISEQPVA